MLQMLSMSGIKTIRYHDLKLLLTTSSVCQCVSGTVSVLQRFYALRPVQTREGLCLPGTSMIAVHPSSAGLQANTYSWAAVQPLLAERLDAVVVSHDMPGFGLTQRSATQDCQRRGACNFNKTPKHLASAV